MRLILVGPPGAGKGTQAKRLSERFNIQPISSGDLFRKVVSEGGRLGKKVEGYLKQGRLLPDDLATKLVMERIKKSDYDKGFILDGFPRSLPQAKALDAALNEIDKEIQHVIVLEIDDSEIVTRITGRRMDPETGNIYHLKYSPPPPEIEPRLVQRSDDKEETVHKRLQDYYSETQPMITFYEQMGIVQTVSALGTPDEVEKRILQNLSKV